MTRRWVTKLIVIATVVAASVVVAGPVATAGPPRHSPPDLVALGDSFAAGAGNVRYEDEACARSASSAYAQMLARLRLVTLQAFPACSGATTADVMAPAQLGRITADTDIVTLQAGGNDFGFGQLVYYCLDPAQVGLTCHRNQELPGGGNVQELLRNIPVVAPATFRLLNDTVQARIDAVQAKARVVVVDYGNPFPDPAGRVGPLCPYMDREELGVAAEFANSVNAALKQASQRSNFSFADAAPRFRGLDVCGFASAFFRPAGPGSPPPGGERGILHPNKLGQGIYAAILAGRLYS